MKKTYYFIVALFTLSIYSSNAQTKKWTLEECVTYALKNNISIKQNELGIKSAIIDKKVAFGNFLPNLNGNIAHSWSIGSNTNPVTNARENLTTQYSQVGIGSSVTLYDGLQKINTYRREKLAIIASQYQLDKMKDDIALNVANAYLQILFSKEALKVQTEQLTFDEKQFKRTEELVHVGTIPKGDLLDAKATVAADKQRVATSENDLFLSKLSLAQLLQLDDLQNFDVDDANFEPEPSQVMLQEPKAIIEKAKSDRIELKIAKTNLEIAEKNIKIAKSGYQPTLSAGYNFGTNASYSDRISGYSINPSNPTSIVGYVDGTGQNVLSPNYTATFKGPDALFNQLSNNKGHNFQLSLQIPIFNGFSVKNNIERSKIALERSKIAETQATQDLERNVYTAITNAKGALNSFEAAHAALDARKEAFNYAQSKFAVGMMNAFEFSQAQTLYVNAQSEVLRTKYDYIFKVKVVEFYFGIPIIKNK